VDPVLNPSGTRVYVGVQNAVVVIDATTNTVLTEITENVQPSGGLAMDPSGTWLYVVNYTDPSSVSVVDPVANKVAAIIFGAGRGSTHMAVSPDGTRGYLTNTIDTNEMDHCSSDPEQCPLTVDVLDLTRNTLLTMVSYVGGNLRGIAADPTGKRVYVAQRSTVIQRVPEFSGIAVIGAGSNRALQWIGQPSQAYDVAVSPDGTRIYAVGALGYFAIDATTYTITGTLPTDPYGGPGSLTPLSIALNESGTRAYVTELPYNGFNLSTSGQLQVIDTSTTTIVDTVPVGNRPFGVAVGPANPPFSPPPTATPTPTPTKVCAGDCDGNQLVTVDEIMRCVNIALGAVQLTECPGCDVDTDGAVTVDEILAAVNNALAGCPMTATATATPAGSPAPTPSPTTTPVP
jgi:YVTN family beta-propeller protein